MAAQVICDESIRGYFDELIDVRHDYETGLLIGQMHRGRPHILGKISTPEDSKKQQPSMDLTARKWIFAHADLVKKMSIGGLNIIGAYIFASRTVIEAMERQGQLDTLAFGLPISTKRIILTIPMSRAFEASIFSPSEDGVKGMPGRSAPIKFQRVFPRLYLLAASVNINEITRISRDSLDVSALANGLSRCWVRVNEADIYSPSSAAMDAECGKVLLGHPQRLHDSNGGGRKKRNKSKKRTKRTRRKDNSADDDFKVQNRVEFIKLMRHKETRPIPQESKNGKFVTAACSGLVEARALVFAKSTIREAIQCLISDVSSSLNARLQIVQEELENDDDDAKHPASVFPRSDDFEVLTHAFPRRVFFGTSSPPYYFSEYIGTDESKNDCFERIREVVLDGVGDTIRLWEECEGAAGSSPLFHVEDIKYAKELQKHRLIEKQRRKEAKRREALASSAMKVHDDNKRTSSSTPITTGNRPSATMIVSVVVVFLSTAVGLFLKMLMWS